MSNQQQPARSPAQRLLAEGRLLAGFLDDVTAQGLSEFTQAPAQLQNAMRNKFGATLAPLATSVYPHFRHVDEPEVIALLAPAGPIAGPTALSNLVGFEWIAIDTLIAGHYLAAPLPAPGRSPSRSAGTTEVARYCVVGNQVAGQDVVMLENGTLLSPERLRLALAGMNLGPEGLTVQYSVVQESSPVTVLFVENRAITVRHQERLVALLDAGIREALCLVFYGYGTEALKCLPTVNSDLLLSTRPPCVTDFLNESVAVRIPVHTPRTILRLIHDAIDITLS